MGVWRAAVALVLLATPCLAQAPYPSKQVRIVVPFPAGGSADVLCRIVGEKLSAVWSQPVIVDNRAGAAGNVGAEIAYRAEPDGYTLLCSPPPPLAINRNLYKSPPYDSRSSAHRAGTDAQRHHRAGRTASRHGQELVAYAANPGKVTYASQATARRRTCRREATHRSRAGPRTPGRGPGAGRHRRQGRHLHRQYSAALRLRRQAR